MKSQVQANQKSSEVLQLWLKVDKVLVLTVRVNNHHHREAELNYRHSSQTQQNNSTVKVRQKVNKIPHGTNNHQTSQTSLILRQFLHLGMKRSWMGSFINSMQLVNRASILTNSPMAKFLNKCIQTPTTLSHQEHSHPPSWAVKTTPARCKAVTGLSSKPISWSKTWSSNTPSSSVKRWPQRNKKPCTSNTSHINNSYFTNSISNNFCCRTQAKLRLSKWE